MDSCKLHQPVALGGQQHQAGLAIHATFLLQAKSSAHSELL
jgi:hypothetical protein